MAELERAQVIAQNLSLVESRIEKACKSANRERSEVVLVAVTKTYPVADVEILANLGLSHFGENRDQEGREKSANVPAHWHFQGQIQSNKIPSIASWAHTVHSLDEKRHCEKLARSLPEGKKLGIFIQVALDESPGRGGVAPDGLADMADWVLTFPFLILHGLMAVAPLGEVPDQAFGRLASIHSVFSQQFPDSSALSAGMSDDFESAIAHGATHVRIGSSILGSRSNPL